MRGNYAKYIIVRVSHVKKKFCIPNKMIELLGDETNNLSLHPAWTSTQSYQNLHCLHEVS